MEIGPITGIRALPASKGSSRRTGQWAVQDIENQAHADDESYTPSDNEADEGAEDGFVEAAKEEEEQEPTPALERDADTGQVSFFA